MPGRPTRPHRRRSSRSASPRWLTGRTRGRGWRTPATSGATSSATSGGSGDVQAVSARVPRARHAVLGGNEHDARHRWPRGGPADHRRQLRGTRRQRRGVSAAFRWPRCSGSRYGSTATSFRICRAPVIRSAMKVYEWLVWRGVKQVENTQRRELGYRRPRVPCRGGSPNADRWRSRPTTTCAFPGLAAEWAQWGGQRPFVGTLTLESPTDVDKEVTAWIAAGTPPIFFGFGSIPVDSPADTLAMIAAACAQVGERALVCAGWSDFSGVSAVRPRQGGRRSELRDDLSGLPRGGAPRRRGHHGGESARRESPR